MSEGIADINILMTAANVTIACVNAILAYYSIHRSSKIAEYSQFVDIIRKSDVSVKVHTVKNYEIVEVANKGENPIKDIETKFLLSARKGNETIDLGEVKFVRTEILRLAESFLIPLHEKLEGMLTDSKLILKREEEIPSGELDPFTKEMIFATIDVKQLLEEFHLNVQIDLSYKVYQEDINIKKQFELEYIFEPDFLKGDAVYQFQENYFIMIREISGKWANP